MSEYRVIIPEEKFAILDFRQDDLPGIMVVNESLIGFEPKVVFAWHLSLMIQFSDLADNGMPTREEREVVDQFGDQLDAEFKGPETEKPNALFLARITWNETRELIYRVFDPEPINQFLMEMINRKSYPRPYDFRIDPDEEWKLAQWHLTAGR